MAGGFPGAHAAQQGASVFVTGFLQQQRRTGARMFSRSGTVSNDAFAFGNIFEVAFFEVGQLDVERALDVLGFV